MRRRSVIEEEVSGTNEQGDTAATTDTAAAETGTAADAGTGPAVTTH